jgi:MFS family permease
MVTSQGAGALLAALTASAAALRWGRRSLLARSLLAVSPIAACYWLAPTWPIALVLLAPLGGIYLWTISSLSATCMGRVSRDMQARMSSIYSVLLSGGYAVGLVVQGWLADAVGLRVVPVVAAALLWAISLALWKRHGFAAVEAPGTFLEPATSPSTAVP